jgi:hypothetical protein
MSHTWEKQLSAIVKAKRHKLRVRSSASDFWKRWKADFANQETAFMNGG